MENGCFLFLGPHTPGKMEGFCEGLAVTHVPHFPDSRALPAFLSVFFQPPRGKERQETGRQGDSLWE